MSLLQAGDDKYDKVSKTLLENRSIFMEFHRPFSETPEIEKMNIVSPPRICKTHLPYHFVDQWVERDRVKVIVPLRNPKDTLVSLYHFYSCNKCK